MSGRMILGMNPTDPALLQLLENAAQSAQELSSEEMLSLDAMQKFSHIASGASSKEALRCLLEKTLAMLGGDEDIKKKNLHITGIINNLTPQDRERFTKMVKKRLASP